MVVGVRETIPPKNVYFSFFYKTDYSAEKRSRKRGCLNPAPVGTLYPWSYKRDSRIISYDRISIMYNGTLHAIGNFIAH